MTFELLQVSVDIASFPGLGESLGTRLALTFREAMASKTKSKPSEAVSTKLHTTTDPKVHKAVEDTSVKFRA